jgi:hypothetical protein
VVLETFRLVAGIFLSHNEYVDSMKVKCGKGKAEYNIDCLVKRVVAE